jgi:C-methyltransferase C-terminal domain/Putative zinc binding domain/Methyltransferase domain
MLYKEITDCRLCGSKKLALALDLGKQSLTGIFPKSLGENVPAGPLQLCQCADCSLVQLRHNYDLSQLYGETYGYRSGLNQSMVRHLQQKVAKIRAMANPGDGDLVIDIGANDSTLLQAYPGKGLELVGIDPSGPKFARYYPPHIKLIPDFFNAELIAQRYPGRRAKVVTSIAMFYDLERPMNFVRDVANVLDDEGIWVFEQSYLPSMLDTSSYDTVCHEHLEYYALKQIKHMADRAGLKIVDVELNDVNGGSFSVTAAKKASRHPEASGLIERLLDDERRRGLDSIETYHRFAARVAEHRARFLELLQALKRDGKKVLGYGASTKGNVLIQYCGLGPDLVSCIAEVNEDKFGAFTPGSRIPIVSEAQARALQPDYFLVFPWHFKTGILQREQAFLRGGGQFIFPLPSLEIVSAAGSRVAWSAA